MKVESRQQVVAITKFRIKDLRRELREEEEVLRHDLRHLRKEKMNGKDKTDSDAPYALKTCAIRIVDLDHLKDLIDATSIPLDIKDNLFLWSWTNDTYTLAEVRSTGAFPNTSGIGITKRSPTDAINATAGMRIAVRRALDDWMRSHGAHESS